VTHRLHETRAQTVGHPPPAVDAEKKDGTFPVVFDCEEKHEETSRLSPYFPYFHVFPANSSFAAKPARRKWVYAWTSNSTPFGV